MTQAVTFILQKQKLYLDLTQGSSSEESQVMSIVREKADRGGNKSVSETNKLAA
jgi:hypothetical protein